MDSFNVEDGKIVRELSPYENIYLRNDVIGLVDEWINYFQDLLNKATDEEEKTKCDGAIWSLSVIKGQLK